MGGAKIDTFQGRRMEYRIEQTTPGDPRWRYIAEHSPQTVKYINDPADKGNYFCFVAMAEGETFLGLSVVDIGPMRFGPLADVTVGFLENVLVREEYRRRGVGRALLAAAMEFAWGRGAEHVRWTVEYDNPAGIALYRSVGAAFVPEEDPQAAEREEYYTVVVVRPQGI